MAFGMQAEWGGVRQGMGRFSFPNEGALTVLGSGFRV